MAKPVETIASPDLPPVPPPQQQSPQVQILLSELETHKTELDSLRRIRSDLEFRLKEAEGVLMSREISALRLQQSLDSEIASLRSAPPPPPQSDDDAEVLKAQVAHYASETQRLETQLRETQRSAADDRRKMQSEILETREMRMLPLMALAVGSSFLTWVVCHAKKLLEHRETVLAAAEQQRQLDDVKEQGERRLQTALQEVARLHKELDQAKVVVSKKNWLW